MYQIFTGKRDKNSDEETHFFVNRRNKRTQSTSVASLRYGKSSSPTQKRQH